MKILNWNIEWATFGSARGKRISAKIQQIDPDLVCFTEATVSMIPLDGYVIEADPEYGYPNQGNRRKVVLWSKRPWEAVDRLGSEDLPGGRFISGISADIRFAGVCIPWRDAHVRTGRRDRILWQDHLQYLEGFKALANAYSHSAVPICVLGDFNQRIPRSRQPIKIAKQLRLAFGAGYQIITANIKDDSGHLLIDHVAVGTGLAAQVVDIIPKRLGPGQPLSDHVGVVVSLETKQGIAA